MLLIGLPLLAGVLPTFARAAMAPRSASLVGEIALDEHRDAASVTLALTTAVRPRIFRLSEPERLVIDLPRTRVQARVQTRWPRSPETGEPGLIRGVRLGRRAFHGVRLVLQLRDAAAVRWQWLPAQSPHVPAKRGAPASRLVRLRVELLAARPSLPEQGSAAQRAAAQRPAAQRAAAQEPAANSAGDAKLAGSVASASLASGPTPPLRSIRAAHVPVGERAVIVAVDAGHGGVDPGATGPDGTQEKAVTLAIARALAARIDATPGMRAVLTRDGDYFVPLADRRERARAAHADLFVSIHADSVRDPAISGASVYILSERGASSAAARELAEQENAADLKGGILPAAQAPDLRSVLLNLSQDASIGQGGEAAQAVLTALDGVGAVHRQQVQRAAFVVLKSPYVPSMLVETAYISNRADERRLSSPGDQGRLAQAIYRGIWSYFRHNPPQGSLFARAHAVASSASS